MEARTVNNLPSAAPHDGAVRCLFAIELSKKSWIVAVNTPLSDKISRHTLEACDWRELLELCERIRTRIARDLNAEIQRELQRLELVVGMIKTIEAERDAIASAKTETEHRNAKKIRGLAKIKCIGPEFATALVGRSVLPLF
jgi:hypothetical protein